MSSAAIAIPPSILKPSRPARRVSLEDFLRREERSQTRNEFFDGIIKPVPMAKGPHNEISANFVAAAKSAIRATGSNFRIFTNAQMVFLPSLNYGVYPDAIVVCEKPVYWDDNQVLMINPLLIVEILSRSTRKYDQTAKFDEYKTLSSFKEYVLVEQDFCRVESRFREEPNLWRESVVEKMDESILLKSIGCTISLADIYENIDFKPPTEMARRR